MTRPEAFKLVMRLASGFPKTPLHEATIETYQDCLMDLDHDRAAGAVEALLRTAVFLPAIAEIRAAVVGNIAGPETAWGELHAAIQQHATQPTFSSPLVAEALRLTGRSWADVRVLQFDQYPWLKRDFCAAYREVAERARLGAQVAPGAQLPSREEARAIVQHVLAAVPEEAPAAVPAVLASVDNADEIGGMIRQAIVDLERKCAPKSIPADELANRRALLRQQAERLRANGG